MRNAFSGGANDGTLTATSFLFRFNPQATCPPVGGGTNMGSDGLLLLLIDALCVNLAIQIRWIQCGLLPAAGLPPNLGFAFLPLVCFAGVGVADGLLDTTLKEGFRAAGGSGASDLRVAATDEAKAPVTARHNMGGNVSVRARQGRAVD